MKKNLVLSSFRCIHIQGKRDSQVFDLQENDLIYLYSDGYADQIGGKSNRRLKSTPFKK